MDIFTVQPESNIQTLKKINIHGNAAYNEITAKTIKQHYM